MNHTEIKKQFKILVAINHLKMLGGSEMYTHTLVSYLLKLGYTVDVLTYKQGIVSESIKKMGSNCTIIEIKDLLYKNYDLALISHNSLFILPIKSKYSIQICHGMYPNLEQPTYLADYHITISPEVSDYLNNLGFENEVVNNPIDLERFYPKKPINAKIKNVLSLCQGESANYLLKELCKEERLNLVCYNKNNESRLDIENAINDSDLVISIGRGVIESMACGRAVLIYDHRSYSGNFSDGLLLPQNIEEVSKFNFSGRGFKFNPTKEFIRKELTKYNIDQGVYNLEYAKKHFDVKKVVAKIFEIAKERKTTLFDKGVYQKLLSHYDGKVLLDQFGKLYFVKNNQKCLIEGLGGLKRFFKFFNLSEMSILKGDEKYLNLLPKVNFELMSISQRNLNLVRKTKKLQQK